jgi:DNA-binding transcriptional MerR regulator
MKEEKMKRYFMAEVIKILGISRKTLYLWEEANKIPKAKRDPMSRYRYWTLEDIKKLKKITGR